MILSNEHRDGNKSLNIRHKPFMCLQDIANGQISKHDIYENTTNIFLGMWLDRNLANI